MSVGLFTRGLRYSRPAPRGEPLEDPGFLPGGELKGTGSNSRETASFVRKRASQLDQRSKLECSKQAYALNILAWNNDIGLWPIRWSVGPE